MNKKVLYLSFWKRDITSIEKIDRVKLEETNGLIKAKANERTLTVTKEEFDSLVNHLLVDDKEAFVEDNLCYLYEEDESNYAIRYFLTVYFTDSTYYCVKGTQPFSQPHYKDILNLFLPYFQA